MVKYTLQHSCWLSKTAYFILLVLMCVVLQNFYQSKLLSTCTVWQARSEPDSSSPADLLSSCSTESWSHRSLCGLIRLITTCASFQETLEQSGPKVSGGDRGCLSGLISPLPSSTQAKASQVGIPVRHVSSMPTPHTPQPPALGLLPPSPPSLSALGSQGQSTTWSGY